MSEFACLPGSLCGACPCVVGTCSKHTAYCPKDYLMWQWRGPLIVEELKRSDVSAAAKGRDLATDPPVDSTQP